MRNPFESRDSEFEAERIAYLEESDRIYFNAYRKAGACDISNFLAICESAGCLGEYRMAEAVRLFDETPLTEEVFESLGAEWRGPRAGEGWRDSHLVLGPFEWDGNWAFARGCPEYGFHTVGQLRMACRAFGVKLKETE